MAIEIKGKNYPIKPHQSVLDNKESKPFFDNTDQAITRDEKKCIGCGLCRTACLEYNNLGIPVKTKVNNCLYFRPDGKLKISESKCTRCGQCVMVCPTGALAEKDNLKDVEGDLTNSEKIVVAITAPSMRVSLSESFDKEPGQILEGQMVAALKKLGFDYVFDVNLGADFTTYEEAYALQDRINEGTTPLFTSCCPSRVKFIEDFHPDLIPHLTHVRSPQQCLAVLVKTYFAKKKKLKSKNISVVSIMPCVAKKFESRREGEDRSGEWDVDWVLTTREFIKMLKKKNIDLPNLKTVDFDHPLGESSGAGAIYGASGGVMESAIRTFADIFSGKKIEKIDYQEFRGMEGIKKANLNIGGKEIKIAIATGLANSKKIIDELKKGEIYHYVEVMACPGGCVGGGGQPKPQSMKIIDKRRQALYQIDKGKSVRRAHENPIVQKVYQEFLGCPGSLEAKKHLHTIYDKTQVRICKI